MKFARILFFLMTITATSLRVSGQEYSQVEAFSFQVSPEGVETDTVLTSTAHYDTSGHQVRITETWWNNGWYFKNQYFDTSGNLIRKTLVINDSSYTVETTYDLDNMGNVVNEYTRSSNGEDFIMAYKNVYSEGRLTEARMMFINQKKPDQKPERGFTRYTYDESGQLIKKEEVFGEEKNVTTHYTYLPNGEIGTEKRVDNLNGKTFTTQYHYTPDNEVSLTRTLSGERVISVTANYYEKGRLVRRETMLEDGSKQITMYFYRP